MKHYNSVKPLVALLLTRTPSTPSLFAHGYAMAALVLAANSKFDARLHGKRKLFPEEELLELWQVLQQYCGLMKGLDWIHRDVAR
jgi:hypothetical protein